MADTYTGPLPRATPDTEPYWQALRRHALEIQRCGACGEAFFYPRNVCPRCLSANLTWFRASGRGRLHTFTVIHVAGPRVPLASPYVVAIVELEEGPRMMTNLVGIEPDPAKIRCDMPVEIEFADVTEECTLPRFHPSGSGAMRTRE